MENAAAADVVFRTTRSRSAADCSVRWTYDLPATPGTWRIVSSIADFTAYETDGIAEFIVYVE